MHCEHGHRAKGFTLVELPVVSRRGREAFTLVELLVVIAIIALLVSILLPSLQHARMIAQRAVCATNLKNLHTAVRAYASEYDGEVPEACNYHVDTWLAIVYHEGVAKGNLAPPASERPPDPFFNLGFLYKTRHTEDPHAYFCPATDDVKSYDNAEKWPYRNSLGQASAGSSYYYHPWYLPDFVPLWRDTKLYGYHEFKYEINLPADLPMVTDALMGYDRHNDPEVGGWNIARADGRVEFFVDEDALQYAELRAQGQHIYYFNWRDRITGFKLP